MKNKFQEGQGVEILTFATGVTGTHYWHCLIDAMGLEIVLSESIGSY